jgi:uncharacterized protein (TIGR02996 family)
VRHRIEVTCMSTPQTLPRAMLAFLVVGLLVPSTPSQAQSGCGPLSIPGQFGPYDYRKHPDKVATVEPFHFTPQVEALIKSINGKLGGDIGYTLQRIPNHHRALSSLIRLGERERRDKPDGEDWSVECRLERAIRFAPDDLIVRLLYADFLRRQKRPEDSERVLQWVEHQPDLSPFTVANIGLVYLELGNVPKATELAQQACSLGLPRSVLYSQLAAKGAFTANDDCKVKE